MSTTVIVVKPIDVYDFPDREYIVVRDGHDTWDESVPSLTRANFNYLVEQHNELIELVMEITNDPG